MPQSFEGSLDLKVLKHLGQYYHVFEISNHLVAWYSRRTYAEANFYRTFV